MVLSENSFCPLCPLPPAGSNPPARPVVALIHLLRLKLPIVSLRGAGASVMQPVPLRWCQSPGAVAKAGTCGINPKLTRLYVSDRKDRTSPTRRNKFTHSPPLPPRPLIFSASLLRPVIQGTRRHY